MNLHCFSRKWHVSEFQDIGQKEGISITLLEFNDICPPFSYDFCHFQPVAPFLVVVGCWRTIYLKCLRWWKRPKALHFCALQPNAKRWNHQSRLREQVKLHDMNILWTWHWNNWLQQTFLTIWYACVYNVCIASIKYIGKCRDCLVGRSIFVWCLLSTGLHRSSPVLLTRHWWQSHRAPNAKEYAPGGHLIVQQWSIAISSFKYRLCIYGVYLLLIYHTCICCGYINTYRYIYIHVHIYGCIVRILCTCCTCIHVDHVHVKYTFNVSSGISHLFVYVQNIKLACVTLLFWTLQRNSRVALAAYKYTRLIRATFKTLHSIIIVVGW